MLRLVIRQQIEKRGFFGKPVAQHVASDVRWGIGGFGVVAHGLRQRIESPIRSGRNRRFLGLHSPTLGLARQTSAD